MKKILILLLLLTFTNNLFGQDGPGQKLILAANSDPITLNSGQIVSMNDAYYVQLNDDENFVQYYIPTGKACWSSETEIKENEIGDADVILAFSKDLLAIFAKSKYHQDYRIKKVIAKRKGGAAFQYLNLQDDGNIVIKDSSDKVRFNIGKAEPKLCTNKN